MNIKIVTALRTMSYEALSVLLAIRPIQFVVEEKVQTYTANRYIVYDESLDVRYWPQPVEMPLNDAPTQIPNNIINIFTDGSKIGGKVKGACNHNQG